MNTLEEKILHTLLDEVGIPRQPNNTLNYDLTLIDRVSMLCTKFKNESFLRHKLSEKLPPLVNEKSTNEKFPENMGSTIQADNPHAATRAGILHSAIQAVTKDRNVTHGNPEDSFACIAEYWMAHFKNRGICPMGMGEKWITRLDVAMMMALLKIARTIAKPENPDNYVDIAGYAACGGEIACQPHPTPPYDHTYSVSSVFTPEASNPESQSS